MTISLDTSAGRGGEGAGLNAPRDFDDRSCGDPLEWIRSIGGLPPGAETGNLSGGVLAKVIEREIIPRLFLTHLGTTRDPRALDPTDVVTLSDGDAFAETVLTRGFAEIMDQVQSLIDRGVTLQRIYLDLLSPVARRLGEWWEQDRCTFTDVTLGLARLQQVLREIGRRTGEGTRRSVPKARIYLVPAPGEQHTFGLSMVEEYFLHAGWETAIDHINEPATVLRTVSKQRIDVLGLSVGCEEFFDPLLDLVQRARKSALNREMVVMVGGKFVSDHPEIGSRVSGVTFIANGVNAVGTAETLIGQSPRSLSTSNFT